MPTDIDTPAELLAQQALVAQTIRDALQQRFAQTDFSGSVGAVKAALVEALGGLAATGIPPPVCWDVVGDGTEVGFRLMATEPVNLPAVQRFICGMYGAGAQAVVAPDRVVSVRFPDRVTVTFRLEDEQ